MLFYKNTMRKFNLTDLKNTSLLSLERFSECVTNFLTKAKTFVTTIKYAPWLILTGLTVKTDAVAYLYDLAKILGECSIKAPPESAFRKKLFILT